MSNSQELIAELDEVLQRASCGQQITILKRVTDLFVERAETYSDDQVDVFDKVFVRLVEKAERSALTELSGRLAPIDNAPANIINRLARHDDIAISGPILDTCSAVTDQTLADVARDKSEKHLAAIAGRRLIGASVTDVLVGCCNAETACKMTGNMGANLSELGFVRLIDRAKGDKTLATAIERRPDLPPELQPFLQLALA